jgi:acyl-CoA reductase-like NAD-dependent aldehyde dehydrogenase
MKAITKHYIDGAFVESHGRKIMESINPTNQQVLGSVARRVAGQILAGHVVINAVRDDPPWRPGEASNILASVASMALSASKPFSSHARFLNDRYPEP